MHSKRNYLIDMCGFLPVQPLFDSAVSRASVLDVLIFLSFGAVCTQPACVNKLAVSNAEKTQWLLSSRAQGWHSGMAALEYARRLRGAPTTQKLLHRVTVCKSQVFPHITYWVPRPCAQMAIYGYNKPYRRAVRVFIAAMKRRAQHHRVALPAELVLFILSSFCFRFHFL